MIDLKKVGIIIGHTVTADVIEKAKEAGLSDKALSFLCVRHTINKATLKNIEAANAPGPKPVPIKKETTKKEDE